MAPEGFDPVWKRSAQTVKLLAFGPEFDDSTFEQNGQIRVDFGLDSPWIFDEDDELYEDEEARAEAAKHIKENVEMLLAFTLFGRETLRDFQPVVVDGIR